jgi:HK97 gp10 family phage protein
MTKLDTRMLDAIAAGLDMKTDDVLQSVAFQVEAEAKGNIREKHIIDTGALFNSVNTKKVKRGLYWVSDGVLYGIFHEFGTHKMSARPWMIPAVEKVRQYLDDLFRKLFP